jgi:hypothetical protein
MSEFWGTAIIIGFFCIRLGAPLLITALGVYWLRRLENRWIQKVELI